MSAPDTFPDHERIAVPGSAVHRIVPGLAVAIAVAAALLLTAPRAAKAAKPSLPWNKGDRPVRGWTVQKTFKHSEFARFWLQRDNEATCVEVRYRKRSDPPAWSSRHYRLQPCPDHRPDANLLRALMSVLRNWERRPHHKRFVRQHVDPSIPIEAGIVPVAYLALNAIALVLFLLLAANWLRIFPKDRLPVLVGFAGAVVAVLVSVIFLDPAQIPACWVTVLHEGHGYQNVMQLYGRGVHGGPNHFVLQALLAGDDGMILRNVVYVNICLAAANSCVFFVLVYLTTRNNLATLLVSALFAANIAFMNGAVSETPAQLVTSYFLMAVAASAHLDIRERTGWFPAVAAFSLLVLAAFLAWQTRQELVVLGAPAVAAGAIRLFGVEHRILDRLKTAWQWIAGRALWAAVITLAVGAVSTCLWIRMPLAGGQRITWAVDGLFPFNPSFLTLPWFLSSYLPLGVTLLFVLGTVHAFRHIERTFLLPLSLLVLWRVYYSASHGYGGPFYERFRFLTALTPMVLFLALFGFRELGRLVARYEWLASRKKLAYVLFGLTFLVWCPFGWGRYFGRGHDMAGIPRSRLLLARNQQSEIRYMLDLTDRYPECVFVTRVVKPTDGGKYWNLWGLFGRNAALKLLPQKDSGTIEKFAALHAPWTPCVMFYAGLDCNKVNAGGCESLTRSRPLVEEQVLEDLWYTELHGHDRHSPTIRLSVFSVRVRPGKKRPVASHR